MEAIFFLLATALATIVYTRQKRLSIRLLTISSPHQPPLKGYNWYSPDLGQFYFATS